MADQESIDNAKSDLAIRKQILEVDKEILATAKKIKADGKKASDEDIKKLHNLKEQKKLKEDILNTEEDSLKTLGKESSLNYDINGAEKKLVKLKIKKEKLDKSGLDKSSDEYIQLKNRLNVSTGIVESNINMARTMQGQQQIQDKLLASLGMSRMAIKGMVAGIKTMTAVMLANPLLVIGALLAGALALIIKFLRYTQSLAKELGISAVQARELAFQMKAAEIEGKLLGYDAIQTAKSLAKEFGTMKGMSVENVKTLGRLQASLGISTDTSAKLAKNFMTIGAASNMAGAVDKMKEFTALAITNGVVAGDVMADIADNTEVFAEFAKDGGTNIAEAAVQAKKLGMSIATTAKMANSLLDFESSIEKEMTASLMIGRNINLNKARQLSLEGDLAGAAKAVVDQVGGTEAFNKMDVLQKRSVASAAGLDVSELMKLMSGEGGMDVKDASAEATKQVNQSLDITNQLIAKLAPIQNMILEVLEKTREVIVNMFNWLMANRKEIVDKFNKLYPLFIPLRFIYKIANMTLKLMDKTFGPIVGFFKLIGKAISILADKIPSFGKILGGVKNALSFTKSKTAEVAAKGAKAIGMEGAEKVAQKGVSKALMKMGMKKIPGIGLVPGLFFGAMKAMQGDFTGAGLEIASGAVGSLGPLGMAGSAAIDGVIIAREMVMRSKEAEAARKEDAKQTANSAASKAESDRKFQQEQLDLQRERFEFEKTTAESERIQRQRVADGLLNQGKD